MALISLSKGDEVISAAQIRKDGGIVTVSDLGYMKYTPVSDLQTQKRAGKGQKLFNTGKNDEFGTELVAAEYVREQYAVYLMMKSGNTQTVKGADIPRRGRAENGEQLGNAMLGDRVAEAELLLSI